MDTHKSPDLETIHNHNRRRRRPTTSFSQDFKTSHEIKNLQGSSDDGDDHETITKTSSSLATGDKAEGSSTPPSPAAQPEAIMVVESGRERLKRHRVEMSGRVWIPDIWGQEDLLKKWIDCTVFDSSLEKSSIMSAREALIQEGRSSLLRIKNGC